MSGAYSTGRYVTILDGPVNTEPPAGHPTNGFRWLSQYMLVDQVPETVRDQDTPFRIRMYDTQPRKPKDLVSYRSSLSIGDNLDIGVFPSLDVLFDTVYEWRPRPPPNCKELLKNAGFMLTVSSDNRRWIFNVPEESDLLTLLDLFRTIAPTSCSSADARAQKQDNAILLSPAEAEEYAEQIPAPICQLAPRPSAAEAAVQSPRTPDADAATASGDTWTLVDDNFAMDVPVRGRSGAQSLYARPTAATPAATPAKPALDSDKASAPTDAAQRPREDSLAVPAAAAQPTTPAQGAAVALLPTISELALHASEGAAPATEAPAVAKTSPADAEATVAAGDALATAPAHLDALFNEPGLRAAPEPTYMPSRDSISPQPLDAAPATPARRSAAEPDAADAEVTTRATALSTSSAGEADGHTFSHRFVGQLPSRRRDTAKPSTLPQLPLTPQASNGAAEKQAAPATPSGQDYKAKVFQRTFALPEGEQLKYDFSCSLSKTILLHGRLYMSTNYACFYSSIFGYKTSLIVPFSCITAVKKDKVASVFPGAIHVTVDNANNPYAQPTNKDKTVPPFVTYVFASFMRRDPVIAAFKELAPQAFVAQTEPPTPLSGAAAGDAAVPDAPLPASASADSAAPAAKKSTKSGPARARPALPASLNAGKLIPPAADPVALADVELVQVVNTTLNCSAQQAWRIFFLDGAPRSFAMYHADVIKDEDVRITSWLPVAAPANVTAAPAGKHNTLMLMPKTQEYVRREFVIDIPLNSPIGPPRVKLYKCQFAGRVATAAGVKITMNNTSTTPDAPFGDCFYVVERWELEDIAGGKCCVRMHTGVCITQRPWKMKPFVGTLTSRAKEDSGKQYSAWAAWAAAQLAAVMADAGDAQESGFYLEFKVGGDADETETVEAAAPVEVAPAAAATAVASAAVGPLPAAAVPENVDVFGNQVPLLVVVAAVAVLVSAVLMAGTNAMGSGLNGLVMALLLVGVAVLAAQNMQLAARLDVIEKRLTGN